MDKKISNALPEEGERLDDTGFGGRYVIQGDGFSYGVDAVLLAAFAAGETGAPGIMKSASVLDLGTGNGIIPLILTHKRQDLTCSGIEVQERPFSRAKRTAEYNGLSDRLCFWQMDVLEVPKRFERGQFQAVVSNPPYFRQGAAIPGTMNEKAIARHETSAVLGDFLSSAAYMLPQGGGFYMVHRPDRLADILCEMRSADIEPKTLQFVTPHPGEAPNIVLVHGSRGGKPELRVLPEIAVHEKDGSYTGIIERIYERL